jgi:hypothetical protein
MPPLQPLVEEQFVDATALDREPLMFVEVGLKPIERPAAEGQPQALRIGQGGGDDLGALFGGVGGRTPSPGLILQAGESLVVEAMQPGVDRRPRDAEFLGDLTGGTTLVEGQEDPSPLDEASLGGA